MIVAVLARPGYRDRQVLVLGIDVTTDALIECILTPPLSRSEAERLLREPTSDASAPPLAGLATNELAARVIGTAANARDLGIALGSDAAPVLPIIARALTGAGDGVAWPETLAPWEEDERVQPFGTIGGGTPNCCRAAMYPGARFVILSQFYNSPTVAVARYTSDGTLDRSFNAHGPVPRVGTVTFGGAADNGFQGAAPSSSTVRAEREWRRPRAGRY